MSETGKRVWVIQLRRYTEDGHAPKMWTRISQRMFSEAACDSEAPMLPVTFAECERWIRARVPDDLEELRVANVETGEGVPVVGRS